MCGSRVLLLGPSFHHCITVRLCGKSTNWALHNNWQTQRKCKIMFFSIYFIYSFILVLLFLARKKHFVAFSKLLLQNYLFFSWNDIFKVSDNFFFFLLSHGSCCYLCFDIVLCVMPWLNQTFYLYNFCNTDLCLYPFASLMCWNV